PFTILSLIGGLTGGPETLAYSRRFARWCNGSTADSGSVCHGSNPCRAANSHLRFQIFDLRFSFGQRLQNLSNPIFQQKSRIIFFLPVLVSARLINFGRFIKTKSKKFIGCALPRFNLTEKLCYFIARKTQNNLLPP